jgi:hypothetical protein
MHALLSALLLAAVSLPAEKEDAKPNALTPQEATEGWILLFDGQTTFGWEVSGPVQAADGVLTVGGGEAARAHSTSFFGNCEFQLDFRWDRGQTAILSAQPDHGAGLPLACSQGKWNHLVGKRQDGRLQARWEEVAAGKGDASAVGKATTVNVGPGPLELGFSVPARSQLTLRNVKLRPLGLQSIFNGKDLAGWKVMESKRARSAFTVNAKGQLSIKDGPGDLQSEGQWADFVLQIDCLSNGKHLNSGVFFRCLPGQFWSGYEAQIRNQWEGDDRARPVDYGTGGIYNRQPARKVVSSDHEWFTMTVAAHGNHLAVWVNGYQTADFTDTRPRDLGNSARKGAKTDKGPISLQGHDPTTDLNFRNIRIAELPGDGKK